MKLTVYKSKNWLTLSGKHLRVWFCGSLWKFSPRSLGAWCPLAAPATNLWKFFPAKISLSLVNFFAKVSRYTVSNMRKISIYRSYSSLEPTRLPVYLLLSVVLRCIVGVCEGIKMRECDGGTAWERVESKSYPLTSPDQSIQVSWIVVCQLQRGDHLISPTLIFLLLSFHLLSFHLLSFHLLSFHLLSFHLLSFREFFQLHGLFGDVAMVHKLCLS